MIKYKLETYSGKIEAVNVVKETEKFITCTYSYCGREHQRRVGKDGAYEKYFDSWSEAKDNHVSSCESRLLSAELALQSAKEKLEKALSMEQQP